MAESDEQSAPTDRDAFIGPRTMPPRPAPSEPTPATSAASGASPFDAKGTRSLPAPRSAPPSSPGPQPDAAATLPYRVLRRIQVGTESVLVAERLADGQLVTLQPLAPDVRPDGTGYEPAVRLAEAARRIRD